MVARNFLEIDNNIFYPRIDDHCGQEGIIGMEFPSLNYLHYLVATLFGYTHWYGRLINLLISSIGIYFYGKIIGRFFSKKIVLASTLFLLCSIWFTFSRKMMADTYCISIMFVAIFYGIRYLEKGGIWRLILFSVLASIGILSKIPAGIYFGLAIPLAFKNYNLSRKISLSISIVLPLTLTYLWYFVWCPFLSTEYGIWFNSGRELNIGFNEIVTNFNLCLENFYFHALKSYIILSLFILGLFSMFRKANWQLIFTFLSIGSIFLVYIFKSGFFFYHHDYYIIPFVPMMALISSYALSLINRKWIVGLIMIAGVSEGILNQVHDFVIEDSEKYKLNLTEIADYTSLKQDLIVINGNANPQQIYLTHRKGCTCSNSQLSDSEYLNALRDRGYKYLFVNKHIANPSISKTNVYEDSDYIVYDLNKTAKKNDNQTSPTNGR